MTTLHVMTGLHAGASRALVPGRYRVMGDIEFHEGEAGSDVATITLFDWSAAPLDLQVNEHGAVMISPAPESVDPALTGLWPLRKTLRFGAVTLCLDQDGQRLEAPVSSLPIQPPSDSSSGAGLARTGAGPRVYPARSSSFWGTRALSVGAGLLVAVSTLYGHTGNPLPASANTADFDCERLARNLTMRGLKELRVEREDKSIVISGLVRNAAEGQSVRMATAEFLHDGQPPTVARWEVADEIASTIVTALRRPGVQAIYQGSGRFRVEGLVSDPEECQTAAEALRKDLGPNVTALDFALNSAFRPLPVSAAIAAGGLRYSERLDGAKVFAEVAKGM